MEKFQYYMLNGSVKVPVSLQGKIYFLSTSYISEIKNLSKLNFFVGANNSGKSFLTRELFKEFQGIDLNEKLTRVLKKNVDSIIELFWNKVRSYYKGIYDRKNFEFEFELNNTESSPSFNKIAFHKLLTIDFINKTELLNSFDFFKKFIKLYDYDSALIEVTLVINQDSKTQLIKLPGIIVYDFLKEVLYENNFYEMFSLISESSENNILINHFRYLSAFSNPEVIISHFKKIYLLNEKIFNDNKLISGFDFNMTVANAFTTVVSFKKIIEFQKFLSEQFFEGKDVYFVQTNQLELKELKNHFFNEIQIQIGNENPKFIQHLGTGIQMLIILTWPLFDNNYGVIFVEEPELYLHPGIQRKLMEIYATHPKSENFQFFISTHSNHILDYAQYNPENTSIYRIQKNSEAFNQNGEPSFEIKFIDSEYRNLLFDLGIFNSSVFQANCTIWVEGITDVMYIRTYLKYFSKVYNKYGKFKENLFYMFVPYGGLGNLYNWDFDEHYESHEHVKSAKLSNSIYMLADNDIEKSSNLDTLRMLKIHLQENFHVLPFDCIEKTLLGFNEQAKESYSKYKTNMIDKQSKVSNFNIWLKKEYLKDKRGFAKKQIKKIDQKALELGEITADNLNKILSPSAIELCEKIYIFIENSNQN